MDLVAGREGRVTGYGHRMLQGEILHHVQVSQLFTHLLNGQALDVGEENLTKGLIGRQRVLMILLSCVVLCVAFNTSTDI